MGLGKSLNDSQCAGVFMMAAIPNYCAPEFPGDFTGWPTADPRDTESRSGRSFRCPRMDASPKEESSAQIIAPRDVIIAFSKCRNAKAKFSEMYFIFGIDDCL